jgi:PIN domain nuclease of toxin-antitoxin system
MKQTAEEPRPHGERVGSQREVGGRAGAGLRVLDASALLVLLLGEPGADKVADAIAEGAAMSSVNFSEVAALLVRNQRDANRILRSVADQVTVESFTSEDALTTAALAEPTRASGLSLGDRACLALAQRLAVAAITADREWAKLDLGIEIHLVRHTS